MTRLGIIWGEHRTTELVAMGVKEGLERDAALEDTLFVEYELYRSRDYVELLLREEFVWNGGSAGLNRTKVTAPQILEYERSLRRKYGSLLFNLHDGNKCQAHEPDTEFLIPQYDIGTELLQVIARSAARSGLKTTCRFYGHDSQLAEYPPFEHIIVEFMVPKELLRYPSDKIEELVRKRRPYFASTDHSLLYKAPDVTDPLYKEIVRKYTQLMKDIFIGIREGVA